MQHDRKAENVYETKEAAFEAAVAAASLALRQGHEVRATAPARGLASGSRENSEVCVCFTELTIMSKETPTSMAVKKLAKKKREAKKFNGVHREK